MLKCFARSGPFGRFESKTGLHKVFGCLRNILPIFRRFEPVISCNNSLHFLLLGVTIERSVTGQQEVSDNAHRPYVNGFAMTGYRWG